MSSAADPSSSSPVDPKTTLVALRGSTGLTLDGLRGHLASLLQLENVGALVGSGASLAVGGLTLASVAAKFKAVVNAGKNLKPAWEALEKQGFSADDIEELFSLLMIYSSSVPLRPDKKHLELCYRALFATLLSGAELTSGAQKAVPDHQSFLRKMVLSRNPGQHAPCIFTTNYDLALEWAAENESIEIIDGFSGLHARKFNPRVFDLGWYSTEARGEARFGNTYCYLGKLHGSLSWLMDEDEIIEVAWRAVASRITEFVNKPEELTPPACVIIPPSTGKYLDTVGFVQGELFRRFAEYVDRQNTTILVNGYSLSDAHVNRLLLAGLQNPTFHMVLCCFGYKVEPSGPSFVPVASGNRNGRVDEIARLAHPSITLVGDPIAAFSEFSRLLPDPAIIDEEARRTEDMVRRIAKVFDRKPGAR